MAAVADYKHVDADKGIYGIYNPFFVRITRTGGAVFKLRYRIKVTTLFDSKTYIRDVDPVSEVSFINPVSILQDAYFKAQYVGSDTGWAIDRINDSGDVGVANFSYSDVKVEIGEVSALSAILPPIFLGYDTDDTFYFYSGFENNDNSGLIENYRDASWYNAAPIRIPTVKKTLYRGSEDTIQMICFPNVIEWDTGTINILEMTTTYFANDGTLQSTSTVDISAFATGTGYWYLNLYYNTDLIGVASNDYAEVYFRYSDGAVFEPITETLTIRETECEPKNTRWKLAWLNKYGGIEYQIFGKLWAQTTTVSSGKLIVNDGIDRTATGFSTSYDRYRPALDSYGKETSIEYNIVSDWLTEDEINALKDAYNSPKVYLVGDIDTNLGLDIIPVLVQDRNYKVVDNSNELVKASLRVKVASNIPSRIQ